MPPKSKKNTKPMKNQPSVKDSLLHRKQQREHEILDLNVEIDHCLVDFNDILNNGDYEISTMARVHFRTTSNINDVLDKFIEKNNYQKYNKNFFLVTMIRCVMNEKYRIHYPYNIFKFNTLHDEVIGKFLLIHPGIENTEDLDKANEFYARYRLKHCSVQMELNNPLHGDIKKVIDAKNEKHGPQNLIYYNRWAFNSVLRKFYQSKGMIEYMDLQTITLDEMCEISNFEERIIRTVGCNKADFEQYGQAALDLFRDEPEQRFTDKKLLIKPRICLLCNYIKPEQEALLVLDINSFYKKTNATELLRQNKDDFSYNLDPQLTLKQKSQKLRERFYLQYLRQAHRNMPPFHELYIKEERETFDAELTPQPADITPTKVTYRQRQLCAKNSVTEIVPNIPTSSGSSSTEPTVIENENVEQTVEKEDFQMPQIEMIIEDLLQNPEPTMSEMQLVVMLARSPNTLLIVRESIKSQFRNIFDAMWSEERKRPTLVHYVLYFVKKNPQPFRVLLEKTLSEDLKANALKLFDDIVAHYTNPDNWEPPIITSTQIFDHSLQNCPESTRSGNNLVVAEEIEEEVIIQQPKDFVFANAAPVDPIQIKEETQSQNTQHFSCYSDVQILPPEDPVIVLDSESDEDSMLRALEKNSSNLGRDKFQMRLNAESQSENESPTITAEDLISAQQQAINNNTSNSPTERALSESNSLRHYELRVHQFEIDDRQQSTTTKRKIQTQIKCRPRKKPRRNPPQKITFLSSEEQISPGRNRQNRQNPLSLNDENFSSSSKIVKTFSFNSNIVNAVENGASCFIIEMQRVSFKRDLIFEMCINLPQFSCYDVLIKGDDIQYALNLNGIEWQTLKDNLNIVGEYEYIRDHLIHNRQSGYSVSIVRQLDLYFSTISQIKAFQIISNGHTFSTAPFSSIPTSLNTINAIDSDILKLMRK